MTKVRSLVIWHIYIYEGKTYLPVRAIFENRVGKVSWDNQEKKAIVSLKGKEITIYDYGFAMSGVSLGQENKIVDGRLYIPVREMVNFLGDQVIWNEKNRSVKIVYNNEVKVSLFDAIGILEKFNLKDTHMNKNNMELYGDEFPETYIYYLEDGDISLWVGDYQVPKDKLVHGDYYQFQYDDTIRFDYSGSYLINKYKDEVLYISIDDESGSNFSIKKLNK